MNPKDREIAVALSHRITAEIARTALLLEDPSPWIMTIASCILEHCTYFAYTNGTSRDRVLRGLKILTRAYSMGTATFVNESALEGLIKGPLN